MKDLSEFLDFMDEADDGHSDGFTSPKMPSRAYPEGKQYHVPSPDAETGLRLNALADITLKSKRGQEVSEADVRRLRIADSEEREFLEQVLSTELVAELIADGVKWEHMKRLSMFAFTYFAVSPEAAENAAKNGLFSGKALPPNRAARRKKTSSGTASGSRGSKSTSRRS